MNVDGIVEQVARWTARRSTRRSFLGRAGRGAMLVAAGPGMAVLLAEDAHARVCGQSGYAPKCATFDCDETWGWCWYARGCCADGALKKICDCCAPNTPHPVGYCPSGTRVLCIVESCGADPRLQTRTIVRFPVDDLAALALAISRARFPAAGAAPLAVVGDAEDPRAAAIAAAATATAGGPLLLARRDGVSDEVLAELRRLGTEFAVVIGPQLTPIVDATLLGAGLSVRRVGTSLRLAPFAAEVGRWVRELTGRRTAVVVPVDVDELVLGAAAGLAAAARLPLLVGTGTATQDALAEPRPATLTVAVGLDDTEAATLPSPVRVNGSSPEALVARVAELAVVRFGAPAVALVPRGAPVLAAAAASLGGPVVLRDDANLDAVREWLFAHRANLQAAYPVGSAFTTEAYYELQSILNEFETHLLRGQAGEGLPVIPQPREERPIGKARR